MTTFTLRYVKGHFVVIGPDVPPMRFRSRPEARDWCKTHYSGSPNQGERKGCVEAAIRPHTEGE
jgi:hypothetical protein